LYSAALESLTGALGEKKAISLNPVDDPKGLSLLKLNLWGLPNRRKLVNAKKS
jgi:hypothetical protein